MNCEKIKFLIKKETKIGIAFSGGIDSIFLLHFMLKFLKKSEIMLIHISHNKNIDSVKNLSFCMFFAKKHNIDIKFSRLKLNNKVVKSNGLEFEERNKRYIEILKIAKLNKINFVFFAHHFDDQIETFFYRIFQGCKLKKLKCMSEITKYKSIFIVRPLLKKFKIKLNFFHFEDYCNNNSKFSRNNLRKVIIFIEKKFPKFKQKLTNIIRFFKK
ncbi:tRNA lysidine(34) synthetase TilS [Candidatus Vidania fulgoroideorum]